MKLMCKELKLCLLALASSVLFSGAQSAIANSTWIGGIGSNWNTAANWSSGTVPGSGDNITIPSGLATYPVVSTAGAVCSQVNFSGTSTPAPSLTIANGGSLTSGGNLTMVAGASIVIHSGGTFTLNADCNNPGVGLLYMDGGTFIFNGNNLFIPASLTGGTADIVHSNPHIGITNFYNLVYSGGSPPFTLAGNTTVSGNLDIASNSQVAVNGYRVTANTLTLGGTTETAGGYNNNNATAYILGTSTQVTVTAGPAAQLAFTTQPVNAPVGQTLSNVDVQIQDAGGNNIASGSVPIAVSLNSGAFAAGNTTNSTTTGGSAAFNNLVINTPGSFTMTASASGLASATSSAFAINALKMFSAAGRNQCVLIWPSINGKSYQILYATNLFAPAWSPWGASLPGTGATMVVTNNMGGVSRCFFRLEFQ